MLDPDENTAKGKLSVNPALISFGALAVLCAVMAKIIFWFTDPSPLPNLANQRAALGEETISKHLPPYALPSGAAEALRSARSLEVHLLAGGPPPEVPPAEDKKFHDIPILGSAHVRSPQAVRSIVESLIRGVEGNQDDAMMCFIPRHGIRASLHDGRFIDLVICYQCHRLEIYLTNEPVHLYTWADSRQSVNAALQAAGVDLEQAMSELMPEP